MTDATIRPESPGAERINTPIPVAELQRRWAAIRAAMADARIDVLLMQANNDFMGGYVKYVTDLPAQNGYPMTVVFPREAEMSIVTMGPFGFDRPHAPKGEPLPGVGRYLGTPGFVTAPYTRHADAELIAGALAPHKGARIGLVGSNGIGFATIDHLRRAGVLAEADLTDVSDIVDSVMVVKSAVEIDLIRRTAAMQDQAMQEVFAAIKPGLRDIEAAALAQQICHSHGSEQGIFLCASGAIGTVPVKNGSHTQNRMIRDGDQYTLLIENNGPGGLYCELGRTMVFGAASTEMREEFDFAVRAQDFTAQLLVPGAACREVWDAYNRFMVEHGRPEERRIHAHGQGYNMVERPLIRGDEPMRITADMNIAVHPTYTTDGTYTWICDNYLTGNSLGAERLHRCERRLFERD